MKQAYKCEQCGALFYKYQSQMKGKQHVFCSRACLARFKSEGGYPKIKHPHLSEYNRVHNKERMTPEVRKKLRESCLGRSGMKLSKDVREAIRQKHLDETSTCYRKLYGRHEHRVVAEQILGRPLRKGEVVHHINRNKRDNRPENLMVFPSQAEHARWHKEHDGEEVIRTHGV